MSDGKEQTAPLGLGKLASQVGAMFARDYYAALIRGDMFAWYGEDSLFVHQDEGWKPSEENTVVGHMTIHNKIRELGYNGWRVVVDTMDAQMTHGDNILLLITGNFIKGDRQRPFSQTFLLSPLPGGDAGYYIRNDVLHYHGANVSRVVVAAPAVATPVVAAPVATPAPVAVVAPVVTPAVATKQATPKVAAAVTPSTPAPLELAATTTPNSSVDAAPATAAAAAATTPAPTPAVNGVSAEKRAAQRAQRAAKKEKAKKPKVAKAAAATTETKESDSNGVAAVAPSSVATPAAATATVTPTAAVVAPAPVAPSKPATWAAIFNPSAATPADTNVVISPNSSRGAKAGRGRATRGGATAAVGKVNGTAPVTTAIATGTPIVAKKAPKRAASAPSTNATPATTTPAVAATTPTPATAGTDGAANQVDPKVRAAVDAGTALFIGGLPAGTDEAAVRQLLSSFGATLSVTFVKDKAFCFVEMATLAIADAVLAAGHAKTLRLGSDELEVKKRRITNRDRAGVTGSARGGVTRGGASYRGTRGGSRGRGAAGTNQGGATRGGARAGAATATRATSAPAAAAAVAAQ